MTELERQLAQDKINLRGEVEHLRAENERLRTALDWQPIETAPRDGTRLLLWVPSYGPTTGHFDQYGPSRKWNLHSCLYRNADPTHWQAPIGPKVRATNNAPTKEGK